jgi:hypothetical protein
MDHAFAEQFAEEWYAAWNAHDPERILSHYADDVEVASPLVSVLTGEADGRISGRMRCAPTSPPRHPRVRQRDRTASAVRASVVRSVSTKA